MNNTQAIGYDNLDHRSGVQNDSSTYQKAHENVFDKLLADYYLSQRGEYAESNKLMRQLTDVFESKMSKKDRWDQVTPKNIHLHKMEQDIGKTELPHFSSTAAKKIFELDVLT